MPGPNKRSDCNVVLYEITHLPSGEKYLGKTIPENRAFHRALKKRWSKHLSRAKCEAEKTTEWTLYQKIREFGEKEFRVDLLEIVRGQKVASQKEATLINSGNYPLNTKKKQKKNELE